jgi:hypothetical protein
MDAPVPHAASTRVLKHVSPALHDPPRPRSPRRHARIADLLTSYYNLLIFSCVARLAGTSADSNGSTPRLSNMSGPPPTSESAAHALTVPSSALLCVLVSNVRCRLALPPRSSVTSRMLACAGHHSACECTLISPLPNYNHCYQLALAHTVCAASRQPLLSSSAVREVSPSPHARTRTQHLLLFEQYKPMC